MDRTQELMEESLGLLEDIKSKTFRRLDEVDLELAKLKSFGGFRDLGALIAIPRETPESKAFDSMMRGKDYEKKVLTVGSDPSFGYACPPQLSGDILHALTEGSPMRAISKVYQTDKNSLELLKKSASGAVVYQSSEVGEILETTGLAYEKLTFTPKTEVYLLKASVIQLADSSFNMEQEMSQEVGEAFGTFEANQHINGTEGLIANVGDGTLNTYNHTHGGSTTVITGDNIINLTYSIPTRFLAGARFLMNRTTMGYIRTLKDPVSGAYLWNSLLTGGDREMLAGYPVTLVDNMPDMGSGNYPVAFGNWSKAFGIVDRTPSFTVQRLDQTFAVYGIIGFLSRFRTTHGPLIGEAAHFLQMST